MSGLAILPAPDTTERAAMVRWLRNVAEGAGQLLREIASWDEPDRSIRAVSAWLATDLATLVDAATDYLETGQFDLEEHSDGDERLDHMARLLSVVTRALGDSAQRQFVAAAIAERMDREIGAHGEVGLTIAGATTLAIALTHLVAFAKYRATSPEASKEMKQ